MDIKYLAEEIKASIPAADMLRFYGIDVNRAGFACCPLHGEKTPSLKTFPGARGWHCFGCGAGGSVIDFVMQYFGLDFMGALKKINDDFGLRLPIGEKPTLRQYRQAQHKQAEREAQREAREHKEKAYMQALMSFAAIDHIITSCSKIPADSLPAAFWQALAEREQAEYKLECAEMELMQNEADR